MTKAQWADYRGWHLLTLLREHAGLTPTSTLLDAGCGTLATALPIIEFLEPGHYFGFDKEADYPALWDEGLAYAGLADRKPVVWRSPPAPLDLWLVPPGGVDVLLAHSVLSHLEPEPVEAFLRALRPWVRRRALVSYFPLEAHPDPWWRRRSADVRVGPPHSVRVAERSYVDYSVGAFAALVSHAGWKVAHAMDYGHPAGQQMAVLEPA